MPSLGLPDHNDIFYADAKWSIFIVSRLIGDNITGCKWHFGVLNSSPNAYWTFMYIQVWPNPVTSAMTIVETFALGDKLGLRSYIGVLKNVPIDIV